MNTERVWQIFVFIIAVGVVVWALTTLGFHF
jgi:hypothetical protein